jgi:H+/Cl- antiporter ClcA
MKLSRLLKMRVLTLRRSGVSLADTRRRLATALGAIVIGLVAFAFAKLGDLAQHLFLQFDKHSPYLALAAVPAMFAGVVYLTNRWCGEARGSGIPQVIAATHNPPVMAVGPLLSIRTAVGKIVMTLAMLLVGGSVGREGPTVQVSAAIMVAFHRMLRVPLTAGVLIAGGAAGVAAAFNTPLAGVAFAIEELASAYEQRIAALVMAAVMISGLVSLGIAGDYIYFGAMHETLRFGAVLLVAPLAGITGGVAGGLFSRALIAFANPRARWLRWIKSHPVLLAALCGAIVAAVGALTDGSSWGTGYQATQSLIEGRGASIWFGPAKFLSTLATALSGAPGGIFAPSLAVGAGLGHLLSLAFPNDPMGAVVLLGMMGYFVGVVRAPLTAVIIIMETTASRGMILPLFATALIADVVSALVCKEKLYHGLSRAFMPRKSPENVDHERVESAGRG